MYLWAALLQCITVCLKHKVENANCTFIGSPEQEETEATLFSRACVFKYFLV